MSRRPWAYLVFGFGFVANSVSILLGATHPTVPDTDLWLGMAWVTAFACFVYYLFPDGKVGRFTFAQVATGCLIVAAFARFVGAVGWNPTLGNQFGGGSLWGMLTVAVYRMHAARRYECRLRHDGDL